MIQLADARPNPKAVVIVLPHAPIALLAVLGTVWQHWNPTKFAPPVPRDHDGFLRLVTVRAMNLPTHLHITIAAPISTRTLLGPFTFLWLIFLRCW